MSSTAALPRRRHRVTPRALGLLGIVLALLVAISYPVRQYLEERGSLNRLEAQVDELQAENLELQAEIKRLENPEYIEYLARKCLGMVKKGEIAFVTVEEGGVPAPLRC
jgi:cell division protein FtsL